METMKLDSQPFHPSLDDTKSEDDRISNLPEGLLHHIISFLDLPDAIRARFISRRWRYLCTSIPTLKFDASLFRYLPWFINFVDKALSRPDISANIHRFDLTWIDDESHEFVTNKWDEDKFDEDVYKMMCCVYRWITNVVKLNVQEVSLTVAFVGSSQPFECPCLFTCESLTKLELKMFNKCSSEIILPHSMCFPRLKFLRLEALKIKDEELTNKMFSSCPVLESLVIHDSAVNINISSLTLKHFELRNTFNRWESEADIAFKTVKLYAPNLISFVCQSYVSHDYSLENLSSLVTAHIERTVHDQKGKPGDFSRLPAEVKEFYARNMVKLLRALHNVKDLTLSPWFIEVLAGAPDVLKNNPIEFPNLRRLNLRRWSPTDCFHAMAYLLKSSPNIDNFTLKTDDKYYNCVHLFDARPSCEEFPLYHLKHVRIKGVQGRGIITLKYQEMLLKNAMELDEVVIDNQKLRWGSALEMEKWMSKFTEKLHSLPRASPNVQFLVLK